MWLDDDGDEPIYGEVPDPSTRQWRHPSEIAAEAARVAAAAAPIVPEGATAGVVTSAHGTSSASILWPITVVGGCIAIAALGVVGLYLTGAADVDELQVSSATTINSGGSSLSTLTRPQTSSLENRVYADDADDGAGLDGLDTEQSPLPTTTTPAPSSTTSTTALPTTTVPEVLPRQTSTLVGPAVYSASTGKAEELASLILADGYLLTSASAMAGRTDVSLRIGDLWVDALVSHSDPLSDVAVLTPVDPATELAIPDSMMGAKAKTGINVFLGYCTSDMASPIDPEQLEPDPEETLEFAPAPAEPGCNPVLQVLPPARESESLEAQPYEDSPGDQGAGDDPERAEDGQGPREDVPEAEESPESGPPPNTAPAPPVMNERKGKIYSLDQTLITLAGRFLYDPIRTGIPQTPSAAGSPLRDRDGHVVGLVVAASSPNVSAVPIDRAIIVAKSMIETGNASPAWTGIDVISTSSGVEVIEVEIEGPGDGKLQVGDLIDRVNGEVVIEADHLEHLTREAGPGKALVVRFLRDGERQQAAIRIGTAPIE